MIAKMKKVYLVLLDSSKKEGILRLRDMGIIHLKECTGESEKLEQLRSYRKDIFDALSVLEVYPSDAGKVSGITNTGKIVSRVNALSASLRENLERKQKTLQEIARIQGWGEFDPDDIAFLGNHGVRTSLFELSDEQYARLADRNKERDDVKIFICSKAKGLQRIAVIGEADIPEDLLPFSLPEKSSEKLQGDADAASENAERAKKELAVFVSSIPALQSDLLKTDEEIEFEQVVSGLGKEERLAYLKGFVPADVEQELKKDAASNGWGLMFCEPEEDEEVPTLIKTTVVGRMLAPLTNMLGIVPGYREYDVSHFFLSFFAIFSAMLIGDAGYGLIFLVFSVTGLVVSKKKLGYVPDIISLVVLVSFFITLWGAVTGTWFGSISLANNRLLAALRLSVFSGTEDEVNRSIMFVSFFLGVVQLSIANIQAFLRELPGLKSLSRLGWLAVLVTIYFFILNQVLGFVFPEKMVYLLFAGVALIFLFGQQGKDVPFMKGIVLSLANSLQTFLDVVGSFANIMSYIRLFAVGLASLKIAETFNSMAAPMMGGSGYIFAVIILFLGHSLNIVLGLLAVLVHAVRLNVLEYSGQLGMEWSGVKYQPFQKKSENK